MNSPASPDRPDVDRVARQRIPHLLQPEEEHPHLQRAGEANTEHGGRGVYFRDPSGHGLEMITRPYL